MRKYIFFALTVALFFLFSNALAEDVLSSNGAAGSPTPDPIVTELPVQPETEAECTALPDELPNQTDVSEPEVPPVVIDRWNDPEAYPDFEFPEGAELLEIWFPQIHDADAALLVYNGQIWMIDCADDTRMGPRVNIMLDFLQVKTIDRIINTHPHYDHLNGLKRIADRITVKELDICFPVNVNEHMVNAVKIANENGIAISEFGDEDDLPMGDGKVNLHVWKKTDEQADMNEQSAQIRITYGERSILFMADMERYGQQILLERVEPELLQSDILKYPHHGKTAMLQECYDAIAPQMVVITNAISVPHVRESEKFLLASGQIHVVYTVRPLVHLVTDGTTWLCERVHSELTVK